MLLIKKPGAVPTDVRSYRPISNLPIASKLFEWFVARQFVGHFSQTTFFLIVSPRTDTNFPPRPLFCTCCQTVEEGDVAILALFDLSAGATVNLAILLTRLDLSYGFVGTVLHWFESYLRSLRRLVRCHFKSSALTMLTCDIPQGSELGPILLYNAHTGFDEDY